MDCRLLWRHGQEVHAAMGNWLGYLAIEEELVPVPESSGGCGDVEGKWSAFATGAVDRECVCKWCGRFSARVKDTVEGPLCGICQMRLALDASSANQLQAVDYEPQWMAGVTGIGCGRSVGDEHARPLDAAQTVAGVGATARAVPTKRVSSQVLPGRCRKRECPASKFVGVVPFWEGNQIVYRIKVKHRCYGGYFDENAAALARDYAARRIALLSQSRVWQVNSDQCFLEDAV